MAFYRKARLHVVAAISTHEELVKFSKRTAQKVVTEIDPDYLYVVVSGLHGDEPNQNGDYFRWDDELLRRLPELRGMPVYDRTAQKGPEYVFQTWIGKPNLINHDANLVVGEIVDAWPVQGEKSIDMLLKVARKERELVKGIESGEIEDVSMGCIVGHSYCSVCENLAHDEEEWCLHLHPAKLALKGRRYNGEDGKIYASKLGSMCYEDNRDVEGIETSWITFGEGADAKAEQKVILANKSEEAAMPGETQYLSQDQHKDRQKRIVAPDASRLKSQGSSEGLEAASNSSSPNEDQLQHALEYYMVNHGKPSDKKRLGLQGSEAVFETATAVLSAINDGAIKKTAAIEACVKFGLHNDPDNLTSVDAFDILRQAAWTDLAHEEVIDEALGATKAQATGGEMPNEGETPSGDQAIKDVKHEDAQPEKQRGVTDPVTEKTNDGDFKITEPEGGGTTDIPLTKAQKTSDAAPHAESGDQAITDVKHEDGQPEKERGVMEPIKEQTKDGEYKATDSDTSTSDQVGGDLPYVNAVQAYVDSLTPSQKARIARAAKSTDYVKVICADIQRNCATDQKLAETWPEIAKIHTAQATGGDLENEAPGEGAADLAVETIEHEDMPKDGTPRRPNEEQEEATSDTDFKAKEEPTDLPITKAKKTEAMEGVEGEHACPECGAGMKSEAQGGYYARCGKCDHKMTRKEMMDHYAIYTAKFVRDEKSPRASHWIVAHRGKDILKIAADKALGEDLANYKIETKMDENKTETLLGLSAFGSQQYKGALLDALHQVGAAKLVEVEFGGSEGGHLEIIAQALPVEMMSPADVRMPDLNTEQAPPANADDDVTKDLMEREEEQDSVVDMVAEVLSQLIKDNDERSVDEVYDELVNTFKDEEKSSQFHGMLEEMVETKEEDDSGDRDEAPILEDSEDGDYEEMSELKADRKRIAAALPKIESEIGNLRDENAKLKAELGRHQSGDRIRARATLAANAVEKLVTCGYLNEAEASKKVQEIAKLPDSEFEAEIVRVSEISERFAKAASEKAKDVPREVIASIPNPAQAQPEASLRGDGTENGGKKSYASVWSRPGDDEE